MERVYIDAGAPPTTVDECSYHVYPRSLDAYTRRVDVEGAAFVPPPPTATTVEASKLTVRFDTYT